MFGAAGPRPFRSVKRNDFRCPELRSVTDSCFAQLQAVNETSPTIPSRPANEKPYVLIPVGYAADISFFSPLDDALLRTLVPWRRCVRA
jgi:hypothetical protein